MRAPCSLALAGLLGLAAGCDDGPPVGDLTGEVTLDGAPLAEGVVRFTPVDGSTPTASALIADGKFAERVPVGVHRVEISAPKLPKGVRTSKELKRGTIDEGSAMEELVPERYNTRSELKTEVKRGPNTVRYELKSR
jgi:hypothetical protein